MKRPSLDDLLDDIVVDYLDAAYAPQGLLGWWAVTDRDGVIAYLPTERNALRYRLDEINRRLNPPEK